METRHSHRQWCIGPVKFGWHRYLHIYAPGNGRRMVLQPFILWDYGYGRERRNAGSES